MGNDEISAEQLDAYKENLKLSDTYLIKNDYTNALSALHSASNLFPEKFDPHWLLGLLHYKLGDNKSALLRYEKARKIRPNYFLIYLKIGYVHEKENRLEIAEQFYIKALNYNLKHSDTYHRLITLKQRRGRIHEVIGLYHLMLKYCISNHFETHTRLAILFCREFGDFRSANNHLLTASRICNTDFRTYLFLGRLSLQMNDNNNALNYYSRVLELNPDNIVANVHIGNIYKGWEQFSEAIHAFTKVLNHQPNNPDAYGFLIQCHRHICKFTNLDDMHLKKFKDVVFQQLTNKKRPSVSLQHSLLCNFEPKVLKQITSTLAKQYVDKPCIQRMRKFEHIIPLANSCIRVGYIYRDSSSHPTSELVKSITKLHDGNKFEVLCYSLLPINRLRSNNLSVYGCFIDISNLSSIDAAKKINTDRVHILIDVGDSTKDLKYEILVLKPAPIQVKLLGHPGTSGASFIDYLITDENCSPRKLDCLYTEKLAYLNQTVFFGDHKLLFNDLSQRILEHYNTSSMYTKQILPDNSVKYYTREMYKLPEDSIVYCYFGKLYKINQNTLNMWLAILRGVNNSVLWLLRYIKDAENNIHEFVTLNGIDPSRVIFSNVAPKDEHLRRLQLADIFLDTPLYNGHTSCLDALWAGTPIITLPGDTFASRMATSLLTASNCLETIAETEDHYIGIAIKLGTHNHLLDQIRQKIWQSRTTSVLFDCKSYCDRLESLYSYMWTKYMNCQFGNDKQ